MSPGAGATIVGGMLLGLDRRAAAEFSFFLAMPTMTAAFVHDLFEVKDHLSAGLATEIGIGFVMAFAAAALVIKPFLGFVEPIGLSPLCLVPHRRRPRADRRDCRWLDPVTGTLMQWLRRRFITGFFVTVPLFITVAALVWLFGVVDGLTTPLYDRLLGRHIPGLGLVTTAAAIVLVGGPGEQPDRQTSAAACGGLSAAAAGVSNDLCAGQAAGRGFFPGQRIRVQARRHARTQAGLFAGVSDPGIHGGTRERSGAPAGGVCPHESPVSGRHRHLRAQPRDCSRTSRVEEGIRIFLTGGMALPSRLMDCAARTARRTSGYNPSFCVPEHPGSLILLLRGEMNLTVQKIAGRMIVPMLLLCFVAAVPSVASATSRRRSQLEAGGGEAALVIPDLSSVDFRGINGRTLLMGGLVICRARPGVRADDLHAAQESACARRRCSRYPSSSTRRARRI